SEFSEKVAANVKKHIKDKLDENGEAWLNKGTEYLKNDRCPYCTQNLKNIDLIEYYKDYFSESYKSFKKEIFADVKTIGDSFPSKNLTEQKSTVKLNKERLDTWSNKLIVKEKLSEIGLEKFERSFQNFLSLINELFDKKLTNPIECPDLSSFYKCKDELDQLRANFDKYNSEVRSVNNDIENFKTKLSSFSLAEQERLSQLNNIKNRFNSDTIKFIEELERNHSEKDQRTREKDDKKERLNKITEETLKNYSEGINRYLSNCGASFELCNPKPVYTGGKPSLEYKIGINNSIIDLGKSNSPDDVPSFKNTLSEGDKSTLAFAFFLARIEKDSQIGNKIVVIDDPINSMDVHRKDTTSYELYNISQLSSQTLIFTHSPEFAKLVWDKNKSSDKKCVRTETKAENCKISEWDINTVGMLDYFHHYFLLSEFITTGRGDKKSIAQSIRPLLEGNLRFRFPGIFKDDKWLGDFIDMIRNSADNSEIHHLLSKLTELEDINDYSKRFHHDDEKWAENLANINSVSLKSYSERTTKFCTG
ncbi:MAG: AAA family ATPase, partial [Bacteroidetes bacterium]|nr:AAA family ATPase [Bacteroidota bacterium]